MKRAICIAVLTLTASAANAGPSQVSNAVARTTTKPTSQFVSCFADAQNQASLPWWFVPKPTGGGTVSNLGAKDVRSPYFLDVADLGSKREIRLDTSDVSSASERSVVRAINSCI
jgi:hypothetical protein